MWVSAALVAMGGLLVGLLVAGVIISHAFSQAVEFYEH